MKTLKSCDFFIRGAGMLKTRMGVILTNFKKAENSYPLVLEQEVKMVPCNIHIEKGLKQ